MTPENHAEAILAAALEYAAAKQDLAEKAEHVEYDRGYFLHAEYERVQEAAGAFAAALAAFVDARLQRVREEGAGEENGD